MSTISPEKRAFLHRRFGSAEVYCGAFKDDSGGYTCLLRQQFFQTWWRLLKPPIYSQAFDFRDTLQIFPAKQRWHLIFHSKWTSTCLCNIHDPFMNTLQRENISTHTLLWMIIQHFPQSHKTRFTMIRGQNDVTRFKNLVHVKGLKILWIYNRPTHTFYRQTREPQNLSWCTFIQQTFTGIQPTLEFNISDLAN